MNTTRVQFATVSLFFLMVALEPFLTGCTWAIGPGKDATTRILSRRLAFHGMQKWPDHFATLARICQSACEISEDREKAIQGAFETIAQVIYTEIPDPLIRADLADLIQLIGIKQDPQFKILSLTPDQGRILEVIVCAFPEGTRVKSE